MNQRRAPRLVGIRLDIETRSGTDIKFGSYRYAESPDFDVLICSYAPERQYPGGTTAMGRVRRLDMSNPDPKFVAILTDPRFWKRAFNANFERIALSRWLGMPTGTYIDPENWRCTAIQANVNGIFGTLADAARAVHSPLNKDVRGKQLIKMFSVPMSARDQKAADNSCGCQVYHDPAAHPIDFDAFEAYCDQDVRTEAGIGALLPEIPDDVQEQYEVDQRINDRGFRHFKGLSKAAMEQVTVEKDRLMHDLTVLTGIDNPNSVQQFRAWLDDQGYPMGSLAKEKREEALADPTIPAIVAQALTMKGEASLSSVAKHKAALDTRCEDGRIRGSLQFYGAHTGREAGRGIQPQNLPRYEAPAADRVRLLRGLAGRDAPRIAKGTVRASIVPARGHVFVVPDYNAIEARCLGWLAGEQAVMDEFDPAKGGQGKIYEATAATMFGVSKDQLIADLKACGKCGRPDCIPCLTRGKGKVSCIAEGELVLTKRGLIPIEKVSRNDRVWDGVEWVRHDGVVYLGMKEVITHDGLTATPDHRVWCTAGDGSHVAFGDAASRGDHLVQSGAGRDPIAVGDRYRDRAEVYPTQAPSSVRTSTLRRLLSGVLVRLVERPTRNGWMRLVRWGGASASGLAGPKAHGGEATLHESERPGVAELRREGDRVPVLVGAGRGDVDTHESVEREPRLADRPGEQRRSLRAGESSDGEGSRQREQSTMHQPIRVRSRVLAVQRIHRAAVALVRFVSGSDHREGGAISHGEAEGLATDRITTRVYDLLNAGPRHRFTVSGRLVHNCLALGYAGGAGALVTMGAEEAGIDIGNYKFLHAQWVALGKPGKFYQWNSELHDYPELIRLRDLYRDAFPETKRFWALCAKAWDVACTTGQGARFGNGNVVTIMRDGPHNRMVLPSGRSIWYRFARSHPDPDRPERIDRRTFMGKGKGVGHIRTDTHGGKLCISGDALTLTDRGWVPLRTVLPADRVWDGVNFVAQDGLIFKGVKPVIDIEGVRMTPDHRIMQKGGWREAQQYDRSDWQDVGLPDSSGLLALGASLGWGGITTDLAGALHMRQGVHHAEGRSAAGTAEREGASAFVRLPAGSVGFQSHLADRGWSEQAPAVRAVAHGEVPLHEAERPGVGELRRAWDHHVRPLAARLLGVRRGHGADVPPRSDTRPDGQRRAVLPGELPVGHVPAAGEQQEAVYDLLNCGPLNRFTILTERGPMLVHNCENVTQAVARDVLFDLIMKIEKMSDQGWPARLVFHVHDEVVLEVPEKHADTVLTDVLDLMSSPPDWAPGLAVQGAGGIMERYGK